MDRFNLKKTKENINNNAYNNRTPVKQGSITMLNMKHYKSGSKIKEEKIDLSNKHKEDEIDNTECIIVDNPKTIKTKKTDVDMNNNENKKEKRVSLKELEENDVPAKEWSKESIEKKLKLLDMAYAKEQNNLINKGNKVNNLKENQEVKQNKKMQEEEEVTSSSKIQENKQTISNPKIQTKLDIKKSLQRLDEESERQEAINKKNVKKNIEDDLDDSEDMLSDGLDDSEDMLLDGLDDSEDMIIDDLDDSEDMLSDDLNYSEDMLSDDLDDSEDMLLDDLDDSEDMLSDDLDDSKDMLSDDLDDLENIVEDYLGNDEDNKIKITDETPIINKIKLDAKIKTTKKVDNTDELEIIPQKQNIDFKQVYSEEKNQNNFDKEIIAIKSKEESEPELEAKQELKITTEPKQKKYKVFKNENMVDEPNYIEKYCSKCGYIFDDNEVDIINFLGNTETVLYRKIKIIDKNLFYINFAISKVLYLDALVMIDENDTNQAKTLLKEIALSTVDISFANKTLNKLKEILIKENNESEMQKTINKMCAKEKETLNLIYNLKFLVYNL